MSQPTDAGASPVTDAQREETRAVLGQHYAGGALTSDQYSDRMGTVATANTVGDLRELFSDLPQPYPLSLGGQPTPGQQPPAQPYAGPQQGYGTPPGYAQMPPAQPTYGQMPPTPPGYGQPAYGQPRPGGGYPQPLPGAPYGIDPQSGIPFSDKQKLTAGLLQIFVGSLGVGRFYTGDTGIAIAQLLTCGGCGIWSLIDGIMMLTGNVTDSEGRPLRD
jgi:TM2 domain/Domain of unknown function (DUF1707)